MINKDTYKRLTERRGSLVIDKCGNCQNVNNPQGCTDKKCYEIMKNRLAELEDKIEDGTLVELPCKVGDTLYFPQYYCDSRGCSMHEQSYCCGCKEMITRERNNEKYIIATKNCEWSDIPTIGKKYFVTRAEVEARLKELQSDK